jgi:drug/metabolite transporter (DMT)-like permease
MMTARDWGLIGVLSLLWGGSFFYVEIAVQGLPALAIVWLRVALAAVFLAAAMTLLRTPFPKVADWRVFAVMGLFNNVLPYTLFVIAQGQITGGLASILNATTPLFTVIVAHLATKDERITPAKAAGLALGFGGVTVMMAGADMQGEVLAKLMCLAAALSYGLAGVWGRRFKRMGIAPLTTAFGQVTASAVILLPVMIWFDRPWTLGWPGFPVAAAVVGIASLSTALAYLIYFKVLASAGATNLSIVTFLIPVSAVALGAVFLGERLLPHHIAGFALIALGLAAIDGRLFKQRVKGSNIKRL